MFFDINQGKQYLRRRKNKEDVYEGFQSNTYDDTGVVLRTVDSITPIKSNIDSDAALIADIQIYEDDFIQKRAAYESSYQTLINKTQSYITSPDSSDPTKNKNVFVNRLNDSEEVVSTRVGCYNATMSDYIGTYNDNPNRAMPPPQNHPWQWSSYSDCKNQAIAGNFAYFGLQDFQGGTVSECYLSNDLQQAQSLGETTNHNTGTDGKIYGGPWANAIYAVNPTPDIVGSFVLQPDVGDYIPVSQETCKLRAADLGYSSFALVNSPSVKVYGNNGGVSCNKYCHGAGGIQWQGSGELPEEWKGAQCESAGNYDITSCDFVGQDPDTPGILPCTCMRNDNFPYSTENYDSVIANPVPAAPPVTTGDCYVGENIDNTTSTGYAYQIIKVFEFDKQLNANLCTLLYTGQIGLWNDWQVNIFANNPENDANINAYLQIDHNTPSGNGNCHITRGGAINTEDIQAAFGDNCSPPFEGVNYLLQGIGTDTCIYNNADGRFNVTNCVPEYDDQWWSFVDNGGNWQLLNYNSGNVLLGGFDGQSDGVTVLNSGWVNGDVDWEYGWGDFFGTWMELYDKAWNLFRFADPSEILLQDVNSSNCLNINNDGSLTMSPCNTTYASQQIRMLTTDGNPAENPPFGNWSANTIQTIVNQNGYWPISANYVVGEEGSDPAPGCAKQYHAWYQCGNAGAKQVVVSPEAGGQIAPFDCTAENEICLRFAFYVNDSGMITINNQTTGAFLWAINAYSPDAVPNPAYNATNSKFGRFFMEAGESLGIDEFIGSPSGLYHVVMVNDPATNMSGLQVRYCAYKCGEIVSKDSTANVVYQINPADSALLGYVGFVDDNNTLHQYPSEMVFPGTNYDSFGNYDSVGHDIKQFTMEGLTADDCKTQCNATENCGGFVLADNACFLKDAGMFPYGVRQADPNAELYVRSRTVDGDASCPKTIDEGITANDWIGINPGGLMGYDTLCKLGIVTEEERLDLDEKTNDLMASAAILEDKISLLLENDMDLTNELAKRVNTLKEDLGQYTSMNTKIKKTDVAIKGLNGISEDSELKMMSENYKYLLMTILAIFLVGAIIKVSRK
jgi:hypothetical protein